MFVMVANIKAIYQHCIRTAGSWGAGFIQITLLSMSLAVGDIVGFPDSAKHFIQRGSLNALGNEQGAILPRFPQQIN